MLTVDLPRYKYDIVIGYIFDTWKRPRIWINPGETIAEMAKMLGDKVRES